MSNNQVLSDLIKFRNENIKDNRDSSLIYISTANMNPERNGVSLEDNDSLGKSGKKFYKGDVLVSNIRPYFKKIWKADRDGISSADVLNFIPIEEDMIDKTYLYYLLSADTFFGYMTATAKGTKMPRGDKKALEKYEVRSLKLSEQKLIANILSSFDDKIENNNAIIANLEEQAQTIFKSWFVDFEPFQDGKFKESELGLIPEIFSVIPFENFVSVSSGKRKKNSEKSEENIYPIIGATKITGYTNDYLFDNKVIITGRVGTLGTFQIYNSRIWPSDNTLILSSDYFGYTYFSLNQINFLSLNRGSTQPLVSQKDIKNYKTVFPDTKWLQQFEEIMNPIFDYYWRLEKENKKLAETRDILLPKLMSGEIRLEEATEVN